MKNFISVADAPDIDALVKKALEYKASPFKDKSLGSGKRMGLLFLNPSMRTRLSTQINCQSWYGSHCIQCGTRRLDTGV